MNSEPTTRFSNRCSTTAAQLPLSQYVPQAHDDEWTTRRWMTSMMPEKRVSAAESTQSPAASWLLTWSWDGLVRNQLITSFLAVHGMDCFFSIVLSRAGILGIWLGLTNSPWKHRLGVGLLGLVYLAVVTAAFVPATVPNRRGDSSVPIWKNF